MNPSPKKKRTATRMTALLLTAALAAGLAGCSLSTEDIFSQTLNSSSSSETSSAGASSSSSQTPSSSSSEETSYSAPDSSSDSSSAASSSSQSGGVQTGTPSASDWNLILVNRDNPLPDDFSVELETITGIYKFDTRAASALRSMLDAASADGYPLAIVSAYRTVDRSRELYTNKVAELVGQGYSQTEAEEEAAKWIAPPGTSEHHTGLAVDVVSSDYYYYYSDLEQDFESFDEFQWLITHCADYGFVLRYPKDKEDVTNIVYEPWHYRYVGVENAKKMMAENLCLEEYVQTLS